MPRYRLPNPYYPPDRMQEYELDFSRLSLTVNDLFTEMGYGSTEPEEPVEALTVSMLEEVSSWIVPRCAFGLFDGRMEEDAVSLDGGERIHVGATISSLLKGSGRFALFAATAGTAFQEYQNRLKAEEDILKSFIADIIGTCIAEKAGDCMERLLEKRAGGRTAHEPPESRILRLAFIRPADTVPFDGRESLRYRFVGGMPDDTDQVDQRYYRYRA